MRPRDDNYLAQLWKRQKAAKPTEASEPEAPEPEELPNDPAARAEYLSDELANTREQLAKEREKRQQAERCIEAQARPTSLGVVLRERQLPKQLPARLPQPRLGACR